MSERYVVVDKSGAIEPRSVLTEDELARLCATLNGTNYTDAPFRVERIYTQAELDAAVAAEREACAKVCDGFDACDPRHIADAIRSRGEQ